MNEYLYTRSDIAKKSSERNKTKQNKELPFSIALNCSLYECVYYVRNMRNFTPPLLFREIWAGEKRVEMGVTITGIKYSLLKTGIKTVHRQTQSTFHMCVLVFLSFSFSFLFFVILILYKDVCAHFTLALMQMNLLIWLSSHALNSSFGAFEFKLDPIFFTPRISDAFV